MLLLTVAVHMNRRGGLIGETYKLNETHLAYCSNDKVVPFVWPYLNAPLGLNSYLVLTGMTSAGDPELSTSIDNFVHDYKIEGYTLPPTFPTLITYFGCEPRPAMSTVNANSTGTNTLDAFLSYNFSSIYQYQYTQSSGFIVGG
jgi:hypothetical protein